MTESEIRLVVGIPTVVRRRDYVRDTVRLLLERGGSTLGERAQIVVMNAEDPPRAHRAVSEIRSEQAEAIGRGILHVTAVPDRDRGVPQVGEGPPPVTDEWARKQVLHACALMEHCATMGSHYLHLEDDVVPVQGYLESMLDFLEAQERLGGWHTLAYYSPIPVTHGAVIKPGHFWGFIGVLFRTRDLPSLTADFRRRFAEAPVDHLLTDYLEEHRLELRAHSPSLFEHVGIHSSHPTRIQISQSWRYAGDRTRIHRFLRRVRRKLHGRWLRWKARWSSS